MKSPKRPPLKLTDEEIVAPVDAPSVEETPVADAPFEPEPLTDADLEIVQPTFERPMSERRRRRLLEEQRLAEERAAQAQHAAASPEPPAEPAPE
ncbi:hypothetical protein, partial [Brevundimonas sp. UBA875]